MFELFYLYENMPFTIALCVALLIGIVELFSLLLGGISNAFDGFLPDKDISLSTDIDGFSLTDYLCIGKIPLLMWLVVFLVSYGLSGIILQMIFHLNVYIAGIIVLFLSTIPTRYVSLFLHKVIPQDETDALSHNDFIGYSATIILGKSTKDHPAEAAFIDKFNQKHYIMVEPENDDELYFQGDVVIITAKKSNSIFYVSKF